VDVVEIAALNCSTRSRSSVQIRDAVDLDSLPSPACSHSDSTSRIDRPRTNAPITIAPSGSVLSSLVPRGNSLETNGSAAARTSGISTDSSPSAVCTLRGRKPLRSPRFGPAFVARPAQPRIELVLDGALDDQPRAELASSDSDSRGFSPTPTASNRSICSSISADGGTVRLTAYVLLHRLVRT
jgi:hypothetical protein